MPDASTLAAYSTLDLQSDADRLAAADNVKEVAIDGTPVLVVQFEGLFYVRVALADDQKTFWAPLNR